MFQIRLRAKRAPGRQAGLRAFTAALAFLFAGCGGNPVGPTVTIEISGRVLEAATGTPVAGAKVELWFVPLCQDCKSTLMASGTTDSAGFYAALHAYSLQDCTELYLKIGATAPGYAADVAGGFFSPRPGPQCSAAPQTIDFRLSRLSGSE
jgi:hypothetical protein